MMAPLAGTSTGAAGKASPHLQAWYDEKKAAEEKRRELEGDTGDTRKARPPFTSLSPLTSFP